jgi:hypothetical protein
MTSEFPVLATLVAGADYHIGVGFLRKPAALEH